MLKEKRISHLNVRMKLIHSHSKNTMKNAVRKLVVIFTRPQCVTSWTSFDFIGMLFIFMRCCHYKYDLFYWFLMRNSNIFMRCHFTEMRCCSNMITISRFMSSVIMSCVTWMSAFDEKVSHWIVSFLIWHSEAWTKWLTFRRWQVKMHFLEWKPMYFNQNFTEICS